MVHLAKLCVTPIYSHTQLGHSQLSHPTTQLGHSQLSHPVTQLSHRVGFYFCFRCNQTKLFSTYKFWISQEFYIKISLLVGLSRFHKKLANKKLYRKYLIILTEIILFPQKIFPFTRNLFANPSALKVQAVRNSLNSLKLSQTC